MSVTGAVFAFLPFPKINRLSASETEKSMTSNSGSKLPFKRQQKQSTNECEEAIKKIGIVEDHEDMQLIYKRLFQRLPDVEIAWQEYSAEDALQSVNASRPDLVLVDICLPGMDGISLTRELKKRYPDVKIAISSGYSRKMYAAQAHEAGADAFIEKGSAFDTLASTRYILGLE